MKVVHKGLVARKKYPRIGMNASKTIVLFTGQGEGIKLAPRGGDPIGHVSDDWDEEAFSFDEIFQITNEDA